MTAVETRSPPPRLRLKTSIATGLLLIALFIVAFAVRRAQATMQAFQSGSNLRELNGYIIRYANDHGGQYPPTLGDLAIYDSTMDPKLLIVPWGLSVPADGQTPQQRAAQINAGGHCSYRYLGAGLTTQTAAPYTVIAYEDDGSNPIGVTYCLFGDGHGETMTVPQIMQYVVVPLTNRCQSLETALANTTTKPSH